MDREKISLALQRTGLVTFLIFPTALALFFQLKFAMLSLEPYRVFSLAPLFIVFLGFLFFILSLREDHYSFRLSILLVGFAVAVRAVLLTILSSTLYSDLLDVHLYALDILNGDPTVNLDQYTYIPNASYLSMTGLTYAGLYQLFGASLKTAKFFMVALSGLTCGLIYLAGREITKDYRVGLVAGFLYAGWPALVSYTGVPSSEHIAMFLIVLPTYLWVRYSKREAGDRWVHSLGIYLLLGALIGLVDWYRPVAFVFALAFLTAEVLFLKKQERPWLKMMCWVVFFTTFQLTSDLATRINNRVNATSNPSSRQRAGSTILIGSNFDYNGNHNWEDHTLIMDTYRTYGDDFDAANRHLFQLAYQRITGNLEKAPALLEAKFRRVWQNDAGLIDASSVGSNDAELLDYLGVMDLFFLVTIVAFTLIATIFGMIKRTLKPVFMMQLFILGVSMILLITEAQMHYRSVLAPFLVLLAALGMKNLSRYLISDRIRRINGNPHRQPADRG